MAGARTDARNATFNVVYGNQYNYHTTVIINGPSPDSQPTPVSDYISPATLIVDLQMIADRTGRRGSLYG